MALEIQVSSHSRLDLIQSLVQIHCVCIGYLSTQISWYCKFYMQGKYLAFEIFVYVKLETFFMKVSCLYNLQYELMGKNETYTIYIYE